MRRRRLAITAPSGSLVVSAVFLAFAQIGAALVDGHGAQSDARTHGRTGKWRGRQVVGLEVNASSVIPAPTLLGTPVNPTPSSTIASPSTTPISAASSASSTVESSLPVSTSETSVASSAQSSLATDASSSSSSASSADQSSTPSDTISSPSSAPAASPTTSPSADSSIAPISSAPETTPSPVSAQPSPQETSAPAPIASSAVQSPAPVESSPSVSPSAAPSPVVSEPAPSASPSAPSAAPSETAVDSQPSVITSQPSPEASSPPPTEPASSAPESSPTPSPTSVAAVVETSIAATPESSDSSSINISIGIGESSTEPPQSTPTPTGPPASALPSGQVGSSQQIPSPSPSWASVPSQGSTVPSTSDVILHPEPSSVDSRPSVVLSSASPSFGLPSPSVSPISADSPVSTGDAGISSGHPTASGTYGATVPVPSASESSGGIVIPSSVEGDSTSFTSIGTVSAPNPNGTQVLTYTGTASAASASPSVSGSDWQQSSAPVVASSSFNDAYTPSQTWLIVATSAVQSSAPSQQIATPTVTQAQAPGGSSSPSLPATASIPSSVPTLIVPANSVVRQANVGTGSNDDPVKDDVLISSLLSGANFPWLFVVKSSDATSQSFNTFPALIAGASNISESDVKTYGSMVYQPASWNGDETSLLTQWLAYIPKSQFDTLSAYLRTSNSPLFNQPGIKGQLAAQINTAYPSAATTGNSETTSHETDGGGNAKKRNIIIGVCVAVGGLLWVGSVFWIYKRVKRSNDKAVHRRLSEHMSMFDGGNHATYGAAHENRLSRADSIAASDIDDRPSSFYASPLDNDRSFRQYQRERSSDALASVRTGASLGHDSPSNYGPSVFGNSWFANPNQGPSQSRARGQNPFEDMVQQSFLNTSGSNGNIQHHVAAQRRSQAVQKGMISQPTSQAHSLEFGKEF